MTFQIASNQKDSSHTHDCEWIRPYADETMLDMFGSKKIKCRVCGFIERRIEAPSGTTVTEHFCTTNTELQEILKEAQANWDLDSETDLDGRIAEGLKIALSGDLEDGEVDDAFQTNNFPKGADKWDALEVWAKALTDS